MQGRGKQEIPEKTRRPAASSDTIPTCKTCERPRARLHLGLDSHWSGGFLWDLLFPCPCVPTPLHIHLTFIGSRFLVVKSYPILQLLHTNLENSDTRTQFINSAKALVKQYGFDGLDLAWQFPQLPAKKQRSTLGTHFHGSIWHSIKQTLGYGRDFVDEKEEEHRNGFTALVRDLKAAFRPDSFLLTAAVMPNVNASAYFQATEVSQHLDAITLMAFDYKTPQRNKKQADYPTPLYTAGGRDVNETVDGSVTWWLEQGVPANKLTLGLAMFGRTWKLTSDSQISGVPPIDADGPGSEGSLTATPGLLSYPEVCALVPNPNQQSAGNLLRKVTDPAQKLGTYGFRMPDPETEEGGLWVGYEDPDTVATKATYARHKALGGIAACDITLDDFKGVCNGYKFPVLKAAKERL
ncbi:hypothetical protein PR048_027232 [Dryococelus australis]|uniref:GH18 domain-containing protein n=1 Tax=Dryococelus australis TaxID=614101 RepID=A0ABQ9GEV9_9NEOP|nr:hypothetical protein PR048_027232 [Dryococelus australis]